MLIKSADGIETPGMRINRACLLHSVQPCVLFNNLKILFLFSIEAVLHTLTPTTFEWVAESSVWHFQITKGFHTWKENNVFFTCYSGALCIEFQETELNLIPFSSWVQVQHRLVSSLQSWLEFTCSSKTFY